MNLAPRRPGPHADQERKDVAKAHRLLDRYKAGNPETEVRINWALRMTGDLTVSVEGKNGKD